MRSRNVTNICIYFEIIIEVRNIWNNIRRILFKKIWICHNLTVTKGFSHKFLTSIESMKHLYWNFFPNTYNWPCRWGVKIYVKTLYFSTFVSKFPIVFFLDNWDIRYPNDPSLEIKLALEFRENMFPIWPYFHLLIPYEKPIFAVLSRYLFPDD